MVGTTIDDAAGEAFDKGARLLGLGYPGGAALDRLASDGDPEAFDFPVARLGGLDFSFSGVKTALLYAVRDLPAGVFDRRRADLAASYQRAIVRALVDRTLAAAEELGHERMAVVGGVAANSELRAALPDAVLAPLALCTDNAAMIASAARYVTSSIPRVSRSRRPCRRVGSPSPSSCWPARSSQPRSSSRVAAPRSRGRRTAPPRAGVASSAAGGLQSPSASA